MMPIMVQGAVCMQRRELQMKSQQSGKCHFIVSVRFFPFSEAPTFAREADQLASLVLSMF